MNAFLEMGGYGVYVWPAYIATFIGVGGAIVFTWRSWRSAQQRLAALEADKP